MPKTDTESEEISNKSTEKSEEQVKDTKPSEDVAHIYIGKKPVMSYAMSALIQLGQSGEIVIKGRGMVISCAVDVAQIVTQRLGGGAYDVKSTKIDTEQLGEGDDIRNVSTIEIVVGKI